MGENTGFMDKLAEEVAAFDVVEFLPKLDSVMGWVGFLTRLAVLVGPALILVLGLIYYFSPPQEANHRFGYRCYWGMGSQEAWRYTQKLAGVLWTLAGLAMIVGVVLLNLQLPALEPMDVMWKVISCLIYQGLIVLVIRVLIYITVMIRFDRKGNRRYTWVQLWRGY